MQADGERDVRAHGAARRGPRERRPRQTALNHSPGCGICYEFFTNLTSTTLAAKTDA
jgi:hypothetical protein